MAHWGRVKSGLGSSQHPQLECWPCNQMTVSQCCFLANMACVKPQAATAPRVCEQRHGAGILSALWPRGSGGQSTQPAVSHSKHSFHGKESWSPPGDRQSKAHQQGQVSTRVGEGEQPGLLTPGLTLSTPSAHLAPGCGIGRWHPHPTAWPGPSWASPATDTSAEHRFTRRIKPVAEEFST